MPNPLAKIKGHVEGKWLQEVYQKDKGEWLGLEGWAAQYEPAAPQKESKPDPEFVQKTKAKVAAKAKETILDKLQVGISAKLLLLILEVACRVLQQLEIKLADAPQPPPPQAKQLINTLSAVCLSYRFAKSKKMDSKKATFFRQTALDQLTHILDQAGDSLATLQQVMRRDLADAPSTRSFVSDRLDDMLAVAEAKTAVYEAKVEAVADEAEAVLKAAGIERPPSVPDKDRVKAQKQELVGLLSSVIKDQILTQLETISTSISGFMDKLFVVVTLANAQGKALQQSGKLREIVGGAVEGMYEELERGVQAEVSRVVVLIGSLTEKSPTDEAAGQEES